MKIEQQIYTSCPQGKGYGGISGLQVKARSKGITDTISQAILRYSNHYRTPNDLRQGEHQYFRDGRDLPAEFLSRFPVVLTYHAVDKDLYGLTRIHYLGKDFTGRSGNFYARTLLFHPEDLQPVAFNPLLLARSGIFDQAPPEDQTILEPLESIPSCSPDPVWTKQVAQESYVESYSVLLSAIVQQEQIRKSIILLFKNSQESAAYLEGLLMLLPPETRCRTTFTTYEPDPALLLQRGGQTPGENLHLITTVAPEAGGSFQLRPNELSQYLVWDFGSNIQSKFPGRSIFSDTVIQFCHQIQPEKIHSLHDFLMKLGAGQSPETWDRLVKLNSSLQSDESDLYTTMSSGLDALLITAQKPGQAEASVRVVWPLLKSILNDQSDASALAIGKFCQLLQRLPDTTTTRSNVYQDLIPAIAQEISEGHIQWAHDLAEKLTGESAQMLKNATEYLVKQGWPDLVNVPNETFELTLGILKSLANSASFTEWVVEQLWIQSRQLAEKSHASKERFAQVIKVLAELMKTIQQDGEVTNRIKSETLKLIKTLLLYGFPANARLLLKLIESDSKAIVLSIYRELIREDWPKNLSQPGSASPANQQALLEILMSVFEVTMTPTSGKLETEILLPSYEAADLFDVLGPYWQRTKELLIKKLTDIDDLATAFSFIERIALLLQESKNHEEAYQLWYWYTQKRPPILTADWSNRQLHLIKAASGTRKPQANISQALELMANLTFTDWLSIIQSIEQKLPNDITAVIDEIVIQKLARSAETYLVSPTHPDLDGLMQILQAAHNIHRADKLWFIFKEKGVLRVLDQSGDSRNKQWVRAVIDILGQYHLPQDVFDLLSSLAPPIRDIADGMDKLNQLYPWAVQTGQKGYLEKLVRLVGPPLKNHDQILLMASWLQQTGKDSPLFPVIFERYQAILRSMDSPEQAWDLRTALSQDEQIPAALLVKDALNDLSPWPKDGRSRLQIWHDKVLIHNPAISSALSQVLSQRLPNDLELGFEYFKLLGKDAPTLGRELFSNLINSAPIEKAASLWQFAQQQKDWESTGLPRSGPRGKLLEWLERIAADLHTGSLDELSMLSALDDWQKLKRKLDQDAEHWATDHLCILFSTPDLLKGDTWNTIVLRNLHKYQKQGIQKVVEEYSTKETEDDQVKYFLVLLAMGWEGIKQIDSPTSTALAEMVDKLLPQLPAQRRDLFWKRLEVMAASSGSKSTYDLQRFRQFNSPTAKLGRWIGRVTGAKPSTFPEKSTGSEQTPEKKKGKEEAGK